MSSVREQLVLDLVETYRQMNRGAGYSRDYRTVQREESEPAEYPAVGLLDEEETIEQAASAVLLRRLFVSVRTLERVTDDDEPSAVGNACLADVQRASMADPSRGGLAVVTQIVSADKVLGYPAEDLVLTETGLEISYRTTLTDPAQKR